MNKIMKKELFVLIIISLFAFFGITNVYADEAINEVTVTGIKEPVIGETVGNLIADIKVPEESNYSITEIVWWASENGMYFGNMGNDDVFVDNSGYYYSITLSPNEGYYFAVDENDEYTGTVTTSDLGYAEAYAYEGNIEIFGEYLEYGDLTYPLLEGANQTVARGNEATFVVDADYDEFTDGFVVVGEEMADPTSYTSQANAEGKTVITLSKELIDSLEDGENYIYIVFGNYKYAETIFTITSTNNAEYEAIPDTGINSNDTLLYLSIFLLSVLGLNKVTELRKNN